jgi:hypothetical protein
MSGFWMDETTGVLRPVVEAYLRGEPMTPFQVAAMRAYLRQWIASPTYQGDDIDRLRRRVNGLLSREDISQWLDEAETEGIDPL